MSRERFEVREIKTDLGQTRWQVSGYKPDGTRVRRRFDTKEEAVGKKSEWEIEALNLQDSFRLLRTRLTEAQLLEAESAYQKLGSLSLTTAVDFALRHYRAPVTEVTVEEATKRFMCEKKNRNRRARTLGEYRKEFARLNALHGQRLVFDIRPDDLRPLICPNPKQSAVTTNHHIERLHAFFAWCVRNQYAIQNPVPFEKATVDHRQPEILNNAPVKRLLWVAMTYKDGVMARYFASSFFTALRPDENRRLLRPEDALEHQDKVINLDGEIAKGRKSRLVNVQKNVMAWLRFHPEAPLVGPNFRKNFDKVREIAGFRVGKHRKDQSRPKWIPDIMRHTALSNYFAITKDEKETARWAGNSPDTLHKHYRRNVAPSAAREYWKITPKSLKAEFGAVAVAA